MMLSLQDLNSVMSRHLTAVCNLFHKEGGGCPGEIQLYLKNKSDFKNCPVLPFSGSRFNVIFHNAAGVYSTADVG